MGEEDGRGLREGEPLSDPSDRRRRRSASRWGTALLLVASTAALARDGRDHAPTPTGIEAILVSPEQRRAIDRGLAWLAAKQQPGGMWGEERGTRVADTSLAVLALLAGGSTVGSGAPLPDGGMGPETLRGPYARNVRAGLAYLSRLAWYDVPGKVAGYIEDDRVSRMHGHGFATLALAEASGNMGPLDLRRISDYVKAGGDPSSLRLADQVRWGLERAVRCTERAQDHDTGGWTYEPNGQGHEGSMTVTQIVALRAANDAGVGVNAAVMRHAYDYVRKSQIRTNPQLHGGFAYQWDRPDRVSYGLTAAALTTFFGLGRYGERKEDAEVIQLGMRYMDANLSENLQPGTQWFYYNLFYGAQALYLSADERRIRSQWGKIRTAVLRQQQVDGSFRKCGPEPEGQVEYSTAMACLTLLVPMESLPIFQRR